VSFCGIRRVVSFVVSLLYLSSVFPFWEKRKKQQPTKTKRTKNDGRKQGTKQQPHVSLAFYQTNLS
jgi:hypothetical protein